MGITPMTTDHLALLRLQSWLSPAFPVGAFSYSHGLKAAVEAGWVRDREGLLDWLAADLMHGAGRNDAILLCAAWRAARAGDETALIEAAEISAALRGSAELALESTAQGAAFLRTIRLAWPHEKLEALAAQLERSQIEPTLPIVFGVACAAYAAPLEQAVPLYLQAASANLVSAALRLLSVGQTDGQIVMQALEETVTKTARDALTAGLDDLGSAAVMVDIASLAHETQYTRLFRS
jgi:urease accessory protein